MSTPLRHAARAALALAAFALPAAAATADRGPRAFAAVSITGDAARDPFLSAYLGAAAGEALGASGLGLRPPRATAELLLARGEGYACVASDACLRGVAEALAAPVLVWVDAARATARPGRLRADVALRSTAVLVTHVAVARAPELVTTGEEAAVAAALARSLAESPRPPWPCTVELKGAARAGATVSVDGAAPAPAGARLFLPPGPRRLALEAPGRTPATAEVACAPAHRYALQVD